MKSVIQYLGSVKINFLCSQFRMNKTKKKKIVASFRLFTIQAFPRFK